MLGLPWWVWVVVGLSATYRLGRLAMSKGFRRITRQEFLQFVHDFDPDVEVVSARERQLEVCLGEASPVAVDLAPLYQDASSLNPNTTEARRRVYWTHLKRLHATATGGQAFLAQTTTSDRVRPRLVPPEVLAAITRLTGVPHTPLGNSGLSVVFVIDGARSLIHVTDEDAQELGLDAAGLSALAQANLRASVPAESVRRVVENDEGSALKLGDTYDAARIVVVPEHLRDGEEVVALIPDQDSLVLAPVPSDGNWEPLREGARLVLGQGPRLLDRPLRVTRTTIELA